jgi:pantoate--beta-alanine ligase
MISVDNFSSLRTSLEDLSRPLGFVPTMGFLHEGHLSLVRKAREDCASVVVSIFTNPTQFSENEDLEKYPRNIERDLSLLEKEQTDLVWIPEVASMYPDNFQTWVEVENITKLLEGRYRPTHFRGVTTVVSKLFNAVQPDKAYFGQKDAQQAVVIQQMVADLNYPLDIVVCPTVREEDGLAMSSRNIHLNHQERQAALALSQGLFQAQAAYQQGERDSATLCRIVSERIQAEQMADLQYISCANPKTLQELNGKVDDCLISLAVYIGDTRLIDNVVCRENEN